MKHSADGIYRLDPLLDPRWSGFVENHPRASIFHSTGWLEAIFRTYRYTPVAVTTAAPGIPIDNALVACRVSGWLTGGQLVSLPFSDHCDPLTQEAEPCNRLLESLTGELSVKGVSGIEIRPSIPIEGAAASSWQPRSYSLHKLDIRPPQDEIFGRLHRDCIQRRIRHAERVGVTCTTGVSERMIEEFYRLVVLTRRRQRLPPQPIDWFRNICKCLKGKAKIWLAIKSGQAIGGILTLRHGKTLYYKYGCSDRRFSSFGAMPYLLWKAIREARSNGLEDFDLGRSDWDNPGLIRFKDRWGAVRSTLTYLSTGAKRLSFDSGSWQVRLAKNIIAHLPPSLLPQVGNAVYRHLHGFHA